MVFRSGVSHRQHATILAVAISAAFMPSRSFGGVTYTEDCSAAAAAGSLGVFYDPDWSHEWQLAGVSGAGQVSGINYDFQTTPIISSPTAPAALSQIASPTTALTTLTDDDYYTTHTFPFFSNARAAASISISGNAMHATAQAIGSITPVSYGYVFNAGPDENGNDRTFAQISENPLASKSVARASAGITDKVTVTSSTLAPGTPVQIRLTATLHSQVTDPEAALAKQFYDPGWDLPHPYSYTYAVATFTAGNNWFYLLDGDGTVYPHLTATQQTQTLQTTVGASFTVTETLAAQAVGTAGGQFGLDTIYDNEALAGNTSFFNLVPLTAGINLTSDGGIDYAAVPTPEPLSAALFGLTAFGLLARRSRMGCRQKK